MKYPLHLARKGSHHDARNPPYSSKFGSCWAWSCSSCLKREILDRECQFSCPSLFVQMCNMPSYSGQTERAENG
jgi:hypothetical protein